MTTDMLLRFSRKIDIPVPGNGCWTWLGLKNRHGYGLWHHRRKGTSMAHRQMYEHYNGSVGSLCVCHSCDNPSCVNPSHLFAGTRLDNTRDAARKGRMQHGARHYKAKLTDEDVLTIRCLSKAGEKQKDIASQFGITQSNVSYLINKTWKHL